MGWFQGRMEYGPRALAAEAFLADPRNPEMQKRLNLQDQGHREGFRPFAPAVREEDVAEYFDINVRSPYMLMVRPVIDKLLLPLPENYKNMSSGTGSPAAFNSLPAITHIDNSACIQSVSRKNESAFSGPCLNPSKAALWLRRDCQHQLQCARRTHCQEPGRRLCVLHAHRNGLPGSGEPDFYKEDQPLAG